MSDDYPWDKIYTLGDLRRWSRSAPSLAVVGRPVAHSRSPLMHNTALGALAHPGLAGWRYFKFDIAPEDLGAAFALFRERGFAGLNLTLPHKVLALAHVTRLLGDAAAAGAVNTLAPDGGGFAGRNTDGEGFVRGLRGEFGGGDFSERPLVLFGAGGAARGIAAAALRESFPQILLANRSAGRLEETLAALRKGFPAEAGRLRGAVFHPGAPPPELPAAAIVVNATSLGLRAGDPPPAPPQIWRRGMLAFDIVCGTGETAFLRGARDAGVPASDGFPMLCWQGALAFEIWTGVPAPASAMLAALRNAR